MDTIRFQNKEYKTRKIELPELGSVLISTTSLNDALMNSGSEYISEEAKKIDEEIYFFVEENEIELSDEKLIILLTLEVL